MSSALLFGTGSDFDGDTTIDSNWFIGAKPNGGDGENDYWNGQLDDIRFYNRALSANEVAQLYAYESQPQPSSNTRKASAMAQVVNGFIVGAEVIDGGYGYTSNPDVTISGGGGSGAVATATVTNAVTAVATR